MESLQVSGDKEENSESDVKWSGKYGFWKVWMMMEDYGINSNEYSDVFKIWSLHFCSYSNVLTKYLTKRHLGYMQHFSQL